MILGAHFLVLTFFENFNFLTTLFSKLILFFCRLNWELKGHFWSVAKVVVRIGCVTWNSNLKSYLISNIWFLIWVSNMSMTQSYFIFIWWKLRKFLTLFSSLITVHLAVTHLKEVYCSLKSLNRNFSAIKCFSNAKSKVMGHYNRHLLHFGKC